MWPLILGGAAFGGLAWLALSGGHDQSKPVPESVVRAVAAALKSGDPSVMRSVASTIRSDGFAPQAASLEDAASELEAAIKGTPQAKPGQAQYPMGRGKPNPAPRADDAQARRNAGALAQLLASMSSSDARGSAAVKQAVTDYQRQEVARGFYQGNLDGLYGPKTALSLATDHGIVPPCPLYFSKKDPKGARAAYVAQLARFADADPQRREEWEQAMHCDAA